MEPELYYYQKKIIIARKENYKAVILINTDAKKSNLI